MGWALDTSLRKFRIGGYRADSPFSIPRKNTLREDKRGNDLNRSEAQRDGVWRHARVLPETTQHAGDHHVQHDELLTSQLLPRKSETDVY